MDILGKNRMHVFIYQYVKPARLLKAAALVLTLFVMSCQEIASPEKSGISGLADSIEPIPPDWRRKNGKLLFFAEVNGSKKDYFFDNAQKIQGGPLCVCADEDGENDGCGCKGNKTENCSCILSVQISGLDSAGADETGIVFAEYKTNCQCAGKTQDSCGCSGNTSAECTCEKKDVLDVNRVHFTVNTNKKEYYIRWYTEQKLQPVHEEHGKLTTMPQESRLSISYDSASKTYQFFVNDAKVYPSETKAPYLFEIKKYGTVYYYTSIDKSLPTQQKPRKVAFLTETPYHYP